MADSPKKVLVNDPTTVVTPNTSITTDIPVPSSDVVAFFSEMFKRMFQPSPKFFRIIKWVSIIIAIITGLPKVLAALKIVLIPTADSVLTIIISVGAWIAAFIAALTVDRTIVMTNATTLPFTAKKDAEALMDIEDKDYQ